MAPELEIANRLYWHAILQAPNPINIQIINAMQISNTIKIPTVISIPTSAERSSLDLVVQIELPENLIN